VTAGSQRHGLSYDARERIRAATVYLPDKGGQGVLVAGGFVLTAAHCIEWSGEGAMVLGDHYLATAKTKSGAAFKLSVYAADPVSDIAVLGEPDNQVFTEDADAFEAFREATTGLLVSADDFDREVPFSVHILSHQGEWIRARATRYGLDPIPGSSVFLKAESSIEAGTSGGPIVDEDGRLIGIVSVASGGEETRSGSAPRPHLALPVWVWRRIEAADRESAVAEP
jgi:S1-C subfamily serine protease